MDCRREFTSLPSRRLLSPCVLGWEKIVGNETGRPPSLRWDNKCSLGTRPLFERTLHWVSSHSLLSWALSVMAMIRHVRPLDLGRGCRVDSTESQLLSLSPSSPVRQRVTQHTPHQPAWPLTTRFGPTEICAGPLSSSLLSDPDPPHAQRVYKVDLPWPDKHQRLRLPPQLLSFPNPPTTKLPPLQPTKPQWTLFPSSTSPLNTPPLPGLRKLTSLWNSKPAARHQAVAALSPERLVLSTLPISCSHFW